MANTLNLGTDGNWATKEGSVLGYNSESNNYKPLAFSFSRDTSATVVNKAGLIETVGSGEPRIDFKDNTKGALLLEPTRTNTITYSNDFTLGGWQPVRTTVTSNYGISPDGTQNSTKLVFSAANDYFNRATASSGTETSSIYVKGIEGETIKFGKGGNVASGVIHTLTGDWQRLIVTTTDAGTAFHISTFGGVTAREIEIFGAVQESGSYATSYIPTSGQANGVTRVADSSSQTVPDGVIGQSEGTVYAEIDFANTSGVAGAWSISNGSSANRITMNTTNLSSTQFTLSVAQNYNSGSTKLASANVLFSDKHKVAIKYSGTTLKLFVDGQLADSVSTDGFGNYTNFYVGGNQVGVGGDARKFIQADLYNTALTDQELIALTS